MQATSAIELAWLKTAAQRDKRVRLELLDQNETILEVLEYDAAPARGQIRDGSISVDTSRDVLRTFSLTLADPYRYWTVGPLGRLWLSHRVRLSVGYVINGVVIYWPQGVYLLAAPEVDGSTAARMVRISGADKSSLANGRPRGGLTGVFTIAKNRQIDLAIGDCANRAEWNESLARRNLTTNPALLPWQMTWGPPSGSPWAAAQDIAGIANLTAAADQQIYRLYYDAIGKLTYTPDPDPNFLSPVITFEPSETGVSLLMGNRVQIDDSELRNCVVVRGGGPKGTLVGYTATDTSATLGVSAIGYRTQYWKGGQADPLITSVPEAQARAQYELRRLLSWQERIPLTVVEVPPLDPWDVIRVVNPVTGTADNYQLLSYSLPLTTGGIMQAEAWRVRRVS